jgi:hypothetical protein
MSEDLVLFRADDGQLGLLGLHCSHRRADLSYWPRREWRIALSLPWWLYDRHGNCLETAVRGARQELLRESSPSGLSLSGTRRNYLRLFGTGRTAAFPNYEPFLAPSGHVLVTKIFHECNYFQGNEGNLDPSHVSLSAPPSECTENLKRTVKGSDGKLPLALYEVDVAPEIEAEETDYGVRIFFASEY